ncbi:unnamed protein product [Brugia timori]|nr:unnamed protein product [Brugia timori]
MRTKNGAAGCAGDEVMWWCGGGRGMSGGVEGDVVVVVVWRCGTRAATRRCGENGVDRERAGG